MHRDPPWPQEALRFLAVGLTTTAISYGVYGIGLLLGLHYAQANLIALLVGILFGFRAQGRYVFGNPDPRRVFRFLASWSALYLANIGLIRLFLDRGLDPWTAGAIALVPMAVLSFYIQKFLVFNRPPGGRPQEDSPCSPD